jgi:hypothetical protein
MFSVLAAEKTGTELIKNGSFANESNWYLASNGNASGKGTIQHGTYSVNVSNPGSETWFLQLTQGNLSIKKGYFYTLSFDISASIQRTILTSVCKDREDYKPYSIRDTLRVDTSYSKYNQIFEMKDLTDSIARLELNLGGFTGDIKIRNVSLLEYDKPIISLVSADQQNIAISGEPFRFSWTSVALKDSVNFDISYDNGMTWSRIDSNLASSGTLEWVPGNTHSAWCLLRLSSSRETTTSSIPFQIVPRVELIHNGSFSNSFNYWDFKTENIDSSSMKSSQDSGLTISSRYRRQRNDAVILSQSSIQLLENEAYGLYFSCYSKETCTLKVILSNSSNNEKPSSDTAYVSIKADSLMRYYASFTSRQTQQNAQIKFFPDPTKEITIKNVSLLALPTPTQLTRVSTSSYTQIRSKTQTFLQLNNSHYPIDLPNSIIDLSGRKIPANRKTEINKRSGIFIAMPLHYYTEK